MHSKAEPVRGSKHGCKQSLQDIIAADEIHRLETAPAVHVCVCKLKALVVRMCRQEKLIVIVVLGGSAVASAAAAATAACPCSCVAVVVLRPAFRIGFAPLLAPFCSILLLLLLLLLLPGLLCVGSAGCSISNARSVLGRGHRCRRPRMWTMGMRVAVGLR